MVSGQQFKDPLSYFVQKHFDCQDMVLLLDCPFRVDGHALFYFGWAWSYCSISDSMWNTVVYNQCDACKFSKF